MMNSAAIRMTLASLKPARVCCRSSTPVSGRATSTSRATTSMRGLPMTKRVMAPASRPSTQSRSGFIAIPEKYGAIISGITERGLDLLQVGGDPALVDRPPVLDPVVAGVVAFPIGLPELAVDVQLGEGGEGVLRGAPWHAGGLHQCGYAGGLAAVDHPGHVEAAIEAGAGLARLHGDLLFVSARRTGIRRRTAACSWQHRPGSR